MRTEEEDGDLWFNKRCKSVRIPTTIKDGQQIMLYMYLGRGAVDYEQSYLLGGLVAISKQWPWAALASSAARVAGLASNNCLGPLDTALMIPSDHEGTDSITLPHTPHLEFQQLCGNVWHRLCTVSDERLCMVMQYITF